MISGRERWIARKQHRNLSYPNFGEDKNLSATNFFALWFEATATFITSKVGLLSTLTPPLSKLRVPFTNFFCI